MWYNSTGRTLALRPEFRKCEQIVNFLLTNPLSALCTKNPNSTDRFLCNMWKVKIMLDNRPKV
jgi:hypothetical protein